ncbi:MAG: TIGR03087 family PEP-CTERM/XrtA system glycosyltransferase [Rhodocyclaceae bacterium]|nr:TIGR03087 family PEP-CTERM/XrtA system glycosyltransferase [Rhodocyclaceae bacterium]
MERPPLLLLVHRLPYPPNKGDKVRSYRILRHLAERYRVFLATFVDQPEDWQHVATVEGWCAGVCVRPIHPRLKRLASLAAFLRGEALTLPYYRDRSMARWVREVVQREDIRHGVVFSGAMAQYLEGLPKLGQVVDFCDVDSEKWTQYAPTKPWPLSWVYAREGRRLLAFERLVAARSDASLFVTRAEADLFLGRAPEAASRVAVMENGVDTAYFSPEPPRDNPFPPGGPVLVFTGAMDYWPNVDGVCWFARDILPSLRQTHPGLRFWIVGMNPASEVLALARPGEVVVTGTVPDVRPFLAHASAVVAPLRIARGIQNKVLEAMAMARPVVAHPSCLQGLDALEGSEILAAENAEGFRAALAVALGPRGQALGAAARARVTTRYGWERQLGVLDQVLAGARS